MLKLLIADDHALVRAGLRLSLRLSLGPVEYFEAGDGLEAEETAARIRPGVAILDVGMPKLNGIDATRRITREVPSCKVVMLSMLGDEETVRRAFENGASAFVLKSAPVSEVAQAVTAVLNGERYLSPGLAMGLDDLTPGTHGASPLDSLTHRQREILQRVAEGQSTKEIAFELSLSPKTVEAHRRQMMERLQIFDVASLVRLALRTGLIQPH